MSSPWPTEALGVVAPKCDAPMPEASASVWNLSLEDIESHTGRVQEIKRTTVSDLGSAKCSFDSRHVLYSKLRPYLNKVVLPTASGVGTSELLPLLPDRARLNREFLACYLRSSGFLAFTASNTRGANLPRVSMKALWKHKVPIPPLDEQRRIVGRIREAMARVDELRLLREETKAEADLIEAAVFADFVEQLEQQEEGFKTVALGDVLVETKYGSSAKANTQGKGVPMLRMGNIRDGHLVTEDIKHIELNSRELEKYTLQPGDILINRTNSLEQVGKAATFNLEGGPWVYASYLVRLRVDRSRALPAYITSVINSRIGRFYVYRTARRAIGMVNINVKEIRAMPIPLPSIAQQEAVVARMADARMACVRLRDQLRGPEAGHLTQAILRKAFA